jgi:hypothetical protein
VPDSILYPVPPLFMWVCVWCVLRLAFHLSIEGPLLRRSISVLCDARRCASCGSGEDRLGWERGDSEHMFEMGQDKYDAACPPEFQSTEFLLNHGQLDRVVVPSTDAQDRNLAIQRAVTDVIMKLTGMLRCLCVSVTVCD